MIIEEKVLHGVCLTAHPTGCRTYTTDEITFVEDACKGLEGDRYKPFEKTHPKALVLGCSTGYGLSSRIVLSFGCGADTLGVSFERSPKKNRCATPGWYNTKVFEEKAAHEGLYCKTLDGDAFSDAMKQQVAQLIKEELGKVDLVIYSLASPVRIDPVTGETYKSVLKPVGKDFTSLSLDPATGQIGQVTLSAADEKQVEATIKVMGGEDWLLWIDYLSKQGCLADGAKTIAYSYIGPNITAPIYRNGTIGQAKKDLERTVPKLNGIMAGIDGKAYVSVNKALVTRASAVIPVVPLYITILYRIMKQKGLHESCIEQMYRLYRDKFPAEMVEEDGLLHMDDFEMQQDVQDEVRKIWATLHEGQVIGDEELEQFRTDYAHLHGFGYRTIDYGKDVDPLNP